MSVAVWAEVDSLAERFAPAIKELYETAATAAKIPIITITTMSSISVKPRGFVDLRTATLVRNLSITYTVHGAGTPASG